MSQHTYTLKFTISIDEAPDGVYPIQGQSREVKHESLDDVLGEKDGVDWTREDEIKAQIEKKIKQACGAQKGLIQVNFDSLTEA